MIAKRIGVLLVAITLAASGAYVFVYLQRWEWNRALIAGTFMLASEMIIIAAVLAGRIKAVERKVTAAVDQTRHDRVLRRLREAPAAERNHFAWLRPRVAKATAGSAMEKGLATKLVGFSVPDEPLVEADTDPLALGTHAILLRPTAGSAP